MSQIDHTVVPASRASSMTFLNTPRALSIARVLVPLMFGLYSLWLGADANWDLYNYHLYNPFAWLHGKLQVDLAPAGMQSYFNPLLDVPYYFANLHFPPQIVGFTMGALHGLTFVILLGIAQRVLPELPDHDRYRVPLLLALAGCLTANFLSGLGNSMGDDSSALFNLAGLWVLLSGWRRASQWSWSTVAVILCAGALVGLGTGLKLTNAVFAIAMCCALLFYPARPAQRVGLAFVFGIGVLLGFAVTGGYWLFNMWKTFGNPLYPQFGGLFPNPLVAGNSLGDGRWRPRGLIEFALWPFIITLDSHRVGETEIRQIIWPIVYVLFWIWTAIRCTNLFAAQSRRRTMESRGRFVVLYVAIGYLVWTEAFSIYRYIVAIEVLTPLVIWLLLHDVLPYIVASRICRWMLIAATAVVVTGGAHTWGHERWTTPLWHADVPPIAQPSNTTVVLASTRLRAWGWLVTMFPDRIAFMQLESSFPAAPAFVDRMHEEAMQRGGPIYAITDAEHNWRAESVARANAVIDSIGLAHSERGCSVMQWAVAHLHLHAAVASGTESGKLCALAVRSDDVRDIDAENRADREAAVAVYARNGFSLDPASCVPYRAGIGEGLQPYQWCKLSLLKRSN